MKEIKVFGRTGNPGDGIIYVLEVEKAYRVNNRKKR